MRRSKFSSSFGRTIAPSPALWSRWRSPRAVKSITLPSASAVLILEQGGATLSSLVALDNCCRPSSLKVKRRRILKVNCALFFLESLIHKEGSGARMLPSSSYAGLQLEYAQLMDILFLGDLVQLIDERICGFFGGRKYHHALGNCTSGLFSLSIRAR